MSYSPPDNQSMHNNHNDTAENDGDELDFSLVLASSVHDMKNSLGMLLTSLEEVIEDAPPENETQQKHFSVLQYEASRINSELIQLLSIYRLQNKNLPFNVDENYISETFEDQIARNDVLFRIRDIELTIDCDSGLAWFYDNELVGNVIHNVLINAARYASSKVHLSAQLVEQVLRVDIEDDGSGFPEFMIDAASSVIHGKSATDSTQLGLFFARKIAIFHKKKEERGRIQLSNGGTLGGGVFSIYLP